MSIEFSPIVRFMLLTAAFIIVVAGMKAAADILEPFLLSLFIAVVCSPYLIALQRRGVPNSVAILLIIGVIVIIGVLIGAVIGSAIRDFRHDIPGYQERLQNMTSGGLSWLASLGLSIDMTQWKESFNPSAALAVAGNTLSGFGNAMANAFLILLTVIFILTEEVSFSEKLRLAYSDSGKTLAAIARFSKSVNRYMAIKTGLSLLTGAFALSWLMILGVDYAVLWAVLAFLLNFVPTLGSILAAIPPLLLALIQLGTGSALLTVLGYVVINVSIGNVLEPRIMGRGLNLSALVVLLSLVFWGWVLGPVGMLLSIPLTMTVKIALESHEETRWIGVMLGSGNGMEARPKS